MKKEFIKNMALLVLVIVAICLVGRHDYNEEVLQCMSGGTYDALVEAMPAADVSEIVDEYMKDRVYWDSVGRFK